MVHSIRLRQERSPRRNGWWLSQSIARDPPEVTSPDTFEPAFVVRNVEGRESFERVATMGDLVSVTENRLNRFDLRGANGYSFLSLAQAGDVLRLTGADTEHWVETAAPYNDRDFLIAQVSTRINGTGVSVLSGGKVALTGYSFTRQDVGRWFRLQGMTTPGFNGYAQVLGVDGTNATTSISVITPETVPAATWSFSWAEIQDEAGSGEPRYFPERRDGLVWELRRDGALLLSGVGGSSLRERPDDVLFRTNRWGSLEPSLQDAIDFGNVVKRGLELLRNDAVLHGLPSDGSPVVTITDIGT